MLISRPAGRTGQLERALTDGVRAILREALQTTAISYGTVAANYARLARTEIVYLLWTLQNPGDPRNTDYGSDGDRSPLSSNHSAARFFGVEEAMLVKVGDPRGGYFSAWIDADSRAGREIDATGGATTRWRSGYVPQMLWSHFARRIRHTSGI